ncbi:hypothetical protein Syun_008769 [Stephania yunnanensis]|uniref:Uncharacterized protein n=1 Tax=Stephania yunnanensis TaxID=152371 RepID=A0AAP0PQA8_9MAGN
MMAFVAEVSTSNMAMHGKSSTKITRYGAQITGSTSQNSGSTTTMVGSGNEGSLIGDDDGRHGTVGGGGERRWRWDAVVRGGGNGGRWKASSGVVEGGNR